MAVKIKNPVTVVQSGGAPTPQPLDPVQVYNDERPADWMMIPEPQEGEAYVLCEIPGNVVDTQRFAINVKSLDPSAVNPRIEFGVTDSQGVFTPYDDVTWNVTAAGDHVFEIPLAYYSHTTTDGSKQILVKSTNVGVPQLYGNGFSTRALSAQIVEYKDRISNGYIPYFGSTSSWLYCPINLKFCSCYGTNRQGGIGNSYFGNCRSLIALICPNLILTNGENFFYDCVCLKAIPDISYTSLTNSKQMFFSCFSLTVLPKIELTACTNANSMFKSSGITSIDITTSPLLTDAGSMFSSTKIESVPLFDTSHVTNFASMFSSCSRLKTIPLFDMSSATTLDSMFSGCSVLEKIPLLDTSNVTSFRQTFYSCYALKEIPLLDTSSGTSFYQTFAGSGIYKVPALDVSHGIDFSYMFSGCKNLSSVPNFATTAGTTFTYMFSFDDGLSSYDFSNYDFSSVTSASGMNYFVSDNSTSSFTPITVIIGDKWPASGVPNAKVFGVGGISAARPAKIKLMKTDGILTLNNTVANTFGNSNFLYFYVPDDLVATYKADIYWSAVSARIFPLSEWTA